MALIFFLATAALTADTIYLKDGNEYKCSLVSITEKAVTAVLDIDGKEKVFLKADVTRIILDKKRMFAEVTNINQIDDPDIKRAFNLAVDRRKYENSLFISIMDKTVVSVKNGQVEVVRKYIYMPLKSDGITAASGHYEDYFKNHERMSLDYAMSISPRGEITPIYENLIEDEIPNSNFPEYADKHVLKFSIPKVTEGSLVAYQVTKTFTASDLEHSFFQDEYFETYTPTIIHEIVIMDPELITYRILNKGKFRIKKKNGQVAITYPPSGEKHDYFFVPSLSLFSPRVILSLNTDPKDFSERFSGALDPGSPEIENFLREIGTGGTDPEALTEAVYKYIQSRIANMNILPSDDSFYPRPAEKTIERGYASVLDKTCLAFEALRYLKISSSLLFAADSKEVFGKGEPFNYRKYPYPLLKVELPGKQVYLYFGSKYTPCGILPKHLYSAHFFDAVHGGFGITPSLDRNNIDLLREIHLKGNINKDGHLEGEITVDYDKFSDAFLREFVDRSEKENDITMQQVLNNLLPRSMLIGYSVSGNDDTNKRVTVKMNFLSYGFAGFAGDYLLFNMPLLSFDGYAAASEKREVPFAFSADSRVKYLIEIVLPQGFRLSYFPGNLNLNTQRFSFNTVNKYFNDAFSMRADLIYDDGMAPKSFYFKYRKIMRKLVKFSGELLIGEKK